MDDEKTSIPPGLCQCGCGERTPLNKYARSERGYRRGDPCRFVNGHGRRLRFWEHVNRNGPGGCWDWTATRHSTGYGRYRGHAYAHRYAYEQAYGPIPSGLGVLHKCDRACCVNPGHLYAGTAKDNARDMVDRQRHSVGSHRPNAKLTEADVVAVRNRAAAGETYFVLAEEYGMDFGTIGRAVRRRTWRHVP